jgi:transposase
MGKVYPEEVKRKAVELYRLDDEVTYAQVGRDLGGISGETVRNWCRQADRDEGRRVDGGLTSGEQAELTQLRREKVRLEKENRILKAATAYFAQDQL